jgi:hypothetical protein
MERRLSEAPWFKGIYATIYEILAAEGYLPPPEDILLTTFEEVRSTKGAEKMAACTIVLAEYRANRLSRYRFKLWFRREPPEPEIFAHELIHVCWYKSGGKPLKNFSENEGEMVARGLQCVVVVMAMYNMVPTKHLFTLIDDERRLKFFLPISIFAEFSVRLKSRLFANLTVRLLSRVFQGT